MLKKVQVDAHKCLLLSQPTVHDGDDGVSSSSTFFSNNTLKTLFSHCCSVNVTSPEKPESWLKAAQEGLRVRTRGTNYIPETSYNLFQQFCFNQTTNSTHIKSTINQV